MRATRASRYRHSNAIFLSVAHLGDWLSRDKCVRIVDTILHHQPTVCVEIGVFRGQSALVIGEALRKCGHGVLHAVDPWSHEEAIAGSNATANNEWWMTVDLGAAKHEFLAEISKRGLQDYVIPVQSTSEDYARQTDFAVDFLHIDGNHSEEKSCQDVELWLPRLNSGGVIVFDDTDWPTTKRAQVAIEGVASCIYETGTFKVYQS